MADDTVPEKAGPSMAVQIGVLFALTLLAVGTGWLSGRYLEKRHAPPQQQQEEQAGRILPGARHAGDASKENGDSVKSGKDAVPETENVLPVAAITTNLAAPSDVWVRLELSLVFDGPADHAIADDIHQDLLAYMRTVKLVQVEGASGFQHLKSDLEERAAIRSKGRVKKILVRTLLFE